MAESAPYTMPGGENKMPARLIALENLLAKLLKLVAEATSSKFRSAAEGMAMIRQEIEGKPMTDYVFPKRTPYAAATEKLLRTEIKAAIASYYPDHLAHRGFTNYWVDKLKSGGIKESSPRFEVVGRDRINMISDRLIILEQLLTRIKSAPSEEILGILQARRARRKRRSKWACSKCTFANPRDEASCQMC